MVEALTKFGAKAIAFDVLFTEPGPDAAASEALAKAIQSHRHAVVLGADVGSGDYYALATELKVILPHPMFLAVTPHWGFVQLKPDKDDAVREHFHGSEEVPSLSWKLASLLDAEATKQPNGQRKMRWLNYYGPRGTIPGLSFNKALDTSEKTVRDFFHDRIVFVGSATQSGFSGKRRDQFRTPYSGPHEPFCPGVEFHATQFLNLMRGDWLRRLDPLAETGLVVLSGLVAGFGLGALRPRAAVLTALSAAVLVTITACWLVWQTHTWFAWLVIVAIEIPVALTCSVVRKVEESEMILSPADRTTDWGDVRRTLVIPDHEMLRRIGSGSYGEVWLARSATGTLRAIKIVDRTSMKDPRFEREFAGLNKFEPISRAHEGLVDILHVGRNEAAGVLYYVMELADSCTIITGNTAEGYVPTTLKTKLESANSINVGEFGRLTLALTSALAFLHEQGLIHRDIKPSNIIFVQGQPKLADIGLVAAADETQSFVGTEGYIPPEGPGTPAADVYSLGTVLGELLAKLESDTTEDEQLRRLRDVVERASARNLAQRYQTAIEMLADMSRAC